MGLEEQTTRLDTASDYLKGCNKCYDVCIGFYASNKIKRSPPRIEYTHSIRIYYIRQKYYTPSTQVHFIQISNISPRPPRTTYKTPHIFAIIFIDVPNRGAVIECFRLDFSYEHIVLYAHTKHQMRPQNINNLPSPRSDSIEIDRYCWMGELYILQISNGIHWISVGNGMRSRHPLTGRQNHTTTKNHTKETWLNR